MGIKKDPLIHVRKQLYRLVVARSDINAALKACDLFLSRVRDVTDDLYFPLVNAIIICYARPFADNKPLGPLPKKWQRFEDPELRKLHWILLRWRHWLVAHSDMSIRGIVAVPPDAPVGPSGVRTSRMGLIVQYFHLRMEMFPKIRDACLDLGRRLDRGVEELLPRVFGDLRIPPGITVLAWDLDAKKG